MINIFKRYSDVILFYRISKFEQFGHLFKFRAEVELKDHSRLFIRETVIGSKRKYSYHWQTSDQKLLVRWDNAPDWDVETFPHHKHICSEERVELSYERTLEQVLNIIEKSLLVTGIGIGTQG